MFRSAEESSQGFTSSLSGWGGETLLAQEPIFSCSDFALAWNGDGSSDAGLIPYGGLFSSKGLLPPSGLKLEEGHGHQKATVSHAHLCSSGPGYLHSTQEGPGTDVLS